jgi:phosphoribosyl-ATP pyrophosphohydrolase
VNSLEFLSALEEIIRDRVENAPPDSYTAKLAASGRLKVVQKFGEEAVEVVVAAAAEDNSRVTSEVADLLYHLLVLMNLRGIPLGDVVAELESRHTGDD